MPNPTHNYEHVQNAKRAVAQAVRRHEQMLIDKVLNDEELLDKSNKLEELQRQVREAKNEFSRELHAQLHRKF